MMVTLFTASSPAVLGWAVLTVKKQTQPLSARNGMRQQESSGVRLQAKLTGQRGMFPGGFSPDGRTLATGSNTGPAMLWDTATGQLRTTLTETSSSGPITFSPDGRMLATSGVKKVKLLNLKTGELKATLLASKGLFSLLYTLTFSPDGRALLTVSSDLKALLWDVATGQLKATLGRQKGLVVTAVFSPDGQMVATAGSEDKTAKMWDAATSQLQASLTGHRAGIYDVIFSPDGRMLATAGQGNTTLLWNVPVG
ncbi:MAG: WD40 repeat domain-containing protein [Pyrinomonadaceae bacterium]